MNTPAIHQAMRLEKHPEEMAWLCFPASDYPDGITDLLKLCSSKERLIEFSNANGFDPEDLSKSLFNFTSSYKTFNTPFFVIVDSPKSHSFKIGSCRVYK